MAGKLVVNPIQLNDSATDSNNFLFSQSGATMKLARGATGTLGDILTVPASGAAKIVGAQQLAQIQTFQTGAVATGTTLIPLDNTIPQNTEGDQYMQLSITPTNASSTLEIDVTWVGSHSVDAVVSVVLFRDSGSNALAVVDFNNGGASRRGALNMKHIVSAGSTAATTFAVRAGGNTAGTLTFNGVGGGQEYGGVTASRITIKEYLP